MDDVTNHLTIYAPDNTKRVLLDAGGSAVPFMAINVGDTIDRYAFKDALPPRMMLEVTRIHHEFDRIEHRTPQGSATFVTYSIHHTIRVYTRTIPEQ